MIFNFYSILGPVHLRRGAAAALARGIQQYTRGFYGMPTAIN